MNNGRAHLRMLSEERIHRKLPWNHITLQFRPGRLKVVHFVPHNESSEWLPILTSCNSAVPIFL
jgi:hypothetical protein